VIAALSQALAVWLALATLALAAWMVVWVASNRRRHWRDRL